MWAIKKEKGGRVLKVVALSDIGKVRQNNQDYYSVPKNEEKLGIYILADGMGGYNGGEIASQLAVESVKSYIETNFNSAFTNKEEIMEFLRSAIQYANMVVYEKAKETQELQGMGTTLEVCFIYHNRVYIGHIGDSRIYRIRKEVMRKLTTDHSYVENLVKEGKITKEEARVHPKKNMITKALGCAPFVEPDVMVKGFQKQDILVITSDGLTNKVSDSEIFDIIKQDVDSSCEKLINMANERGGNDNITVIVIYNNEN